MKTIFFQQIKSENYLSILPLKSEILVWKNTLKHKKFLHILSIPFYYFKRIFFLNSYLIKYDKFPKSIGGKILLIMALPNILRPVKTELIRCGANDGGYLAKKINQVRQYSYFVWTLDDCSFENDFLKIKDIPILF